MSVETDVAQGSQQWVEVELKSQGKKVKVPPEVGQMLQELDNGYLRMSDYTKKTQEIATARDSFTQERAQHAQDLAKIELLSRNAAAKAVIEQLMINPNYVPPMPVPRQQPQQQTDEYGQPIAQSQVTQPPVADPRYDVLANQVRMLQEGIGKTLQSQMIKNVRAVLATQYADRKYVNPVEVEAYVVTNPNTWGLAPDAQAQGAVMALYGQQEAQRLIDIGRTQAEKKFEEQQKAAAEAAHVASLTPTPVLDRQGKTIPHPQQDPSGFKAWADAKMAEGEAGVREVIDATIQLSGKPFTATPSEIVVPTMRIV